MGTRWGHGGDDAAVTADVDECARSPPPCPHGRCENLPGSFRCVCPSGFRATTHGGHCEDIDECETPTACPGQECVNTAGSFQCRPCRDGFEPHHGRCADVNECLEGDFCFPHGECLNADGSYRCLCAQGYTSAPDGTACLDEDECSGPGPRCGAHAACHNLPGSFQCACHQGYEAARHGHHCQDVDECRMFAPHLCRGGVCVNAAPGFSCYCPTGYYYEREHLQCVAPKRRGPGPAPPRMAEPRPLFDDTSGGSAPGRAYGAPPPPPPNPSAAAAAAFLAEPVSTIAAAYGSSWASQGREMVDRNIDRFLPVGRLKYYFAVDTVYVGRKLGLLFFPFLHQIDRFLPVGRLKYYFAVDTVYVGRKLGLLFFPFLHQDWQVHYQQDGPVAPRFDVNAPDLYIPGTTPKCPQIDPRCPKVSPPLSTNVPNAVPAAMAFITYLLVAGLALGTQNRFSPDSLGLQASSALAWLLLEVLAVLLSLYLFSLPTDLTTPDLLAFAGYKYVG
ncbi:UNVERIFIED_CONTAM: hypothetical protein H355_000504 [Colinus virginianus]|nr:hypothetical protein H355_000504 [Colinus virginianus]